MYELVYREHDVAVLKHAFEGTPLEDIEPERIAVLEVNIELELL